MTDPTISIPELESWLTSVVADRCGLPTADIDADRPLVDYGLSSRDAVELAGRLEDLLDRTLPTTLVWDHPTIRRLASALLTADPPRPTSHPAVTRPAGTGAEAEGEAVAVVGLGCRLPGNVAGPEDLWRLLAGGADAVGEVPAERWLEPETAADREVVERTTRAGGFLDDIAGFDAGFFGISPLEARRMDPQQRILLEVAWEALEHAGISPASLHGTPTGVFVGLSASEYGQRSMSALSDVDAWSGTGGALSIAANRISYAFDLRGPSLALDTACSSSLVAVHVAIQSLRAGETNLAIAAGANLLLGPEVTTAFHQMGVISERGRCQPFSAGADGIVRAEGAAVVVLKRLADAQRDGDRVLAVLRGSAVNQDGRSNGITAPNVEAQQDLLRAAYLAAGIDPREVDYVEAHGTGTLLGDPIEARALGAVLGGGRPDERPLLIGSVKSNFGHLEAAAGIVGLIKVVLSVHRRRIPASLHVDQLNPHIDFDALGLAVVDRQIDWPPADRPSRAGVSAFGFGGTNAHVVVEAAPTRAPRPSAEPEPDPDRPTRFVLAGPDQSRIRDSALALAGWLESDGAAARLTDIEFTLARRISGPARAAVVARDRPALIDGLKVCAAGGSAPQLVEARAARPDAGPVWVFSGQGSQWAGMAMDLLRDEPAFAEALLELDALIRAEAGFSVCEALDRREEIAPIERLQPVLFAVQVALARLLSAHGLAPTAVIGHSLGEVGAAVAVGALSVRDAVRVVVLRSRLLATLEGTGGAMALLELSPAELAELAAMPGEFGAVEIAAFNAPSQIAVAGTVAEVEALVGAVAATGRLAKLIKSTVAGHCRLVDPIVGQLRDGLATLEPVAARTRFYGTALADPRQTTSFDADYWVANIRQPVRFAQAVAAAVGDGHRTFIEISPHPVLLHALLDNARAAGASDPLVLSTGRRCDDETLHLHAQLASLAINAAAPPKADPRGSGDARVIDLPTRPWRHEPHWLEPRTRRSATSASDGPSAAPSTATHGRLGVRVELPGVRVELPGVRLALPGVRVELPGEATMTWQFALEPGDRDDPWTGEPTATVGLGAWLELIAAAATEAFGAGANASLEIGDLLLGAQLPLGDRRVVSTAVDRQSRSAGRLTVHSQAPAGRWRAHVSATLDAAPAAEAPAPASAATMQVLLTAEPSHAGPDRPPWGLESALEALVESLGSIDDDERWVVDSIGLTRWIGPPAEATRIRASVDPPSAPSERTADLWLADADGRVHLACERIGLRRVRRAELPTSVRSKLRTRAWQPLAAPPIEAGPGRWLIVGDASDPLPTDLAAALASRGGEAAVVAAGDLPRTLRSDHAPQRIVVLVPTPPAGETVEDAVTRAEQAVLVAAGVVAALDSRPATPAGTRIWLVTSGGAAVGERDRVDPGGAALRGLLRALATAHPELRPAWIDLDPPQRLDGLLRELAIDDDEDEVAWRAGQRHVARLVVPELPAPAPAPAPAQASDAARMVRPDGAYLVSGGLGRNGLMVAGWLAERGAGRIVLNDVRAPDPAAEHELTRLRGLGSEIVVIEGDISTPGVATRAVAACSAPGARLCGIAHAADTADTADTWSARALGAVRLIDASAGAQLDWWTSLSSASALLGGPGAAAGAAADACVEAVVERLRAAGVAAGSISWSVRPIPAGDDHPPGPVGTITPLEATEALACLLADRTPAAVVLKTWDGDLGQAAPALIRVPLFAGILETSTTPARASGGRSPGVTESAGAASGAGLAVARRVHEQITGVLGIDSTRQAGNSALTAAGLDSLLAVRLRNALQNDFGVALPLPVLLGGASAGDIVALICDELKLTRAPIRAPGSVARVGPRDGTERMVAAVWREVLGREDFGVTQEFATLGGDHRMASRASGLLSLRAGRPLVAGELFGPGATIERQARLLREPQPATAGSPPRRPPQPPLLRRLRRLRDGVAPTPLFVFHPAGGDTLVYRQLVDCLDPSLTVWGCDRFDGALSVTERAARYVELLRGVQPDGPYLLAGWSFGGVLAYETAQLLRAAGERVELLALIDTILPLPDPPGTSEREIVQLRFQRFAAFLEASYGKPVSLPYERLAGLDDESQADVVIDAVVAAGLIDPRGNEAIIRHQRTSYLDVRAVERYVPAPYDGPVVFYTPRDVQADGVRDPRFDRDEPSRGWDAFCGERLEIVSVPGHHLSLLDSPFVETLAGHIDLLLADYRLTVA